MHWPDLCHYGVTSIGSWAFGYCSSLTSIDIPSSVTSIGDGAFSGCTGLTSVTIGSGVPRIGEKAFEECSNLTSVTISCPYVVGWFRGNTTISEIILGEGVTNIGETAFEGCTGLTSITIPSSVTSIGGWAFKDCTSLTSVHIKDLTAWCGITFVDNPLYYAQHLFMNGKEITDLIIPNGVTNIGERAFWRCTGLTSVVIPSSVTSIGETAFAACTGLTSIIIPEGVTSIGSSAFTGCSSLTSITIPESVTSIGVPAFSGCSGLTSITVAEGNSVYDSRNDCNAIIETASNTLVAGCQNTVIPNNVTNIGEYAFSVRTGLTSIEIPNSVTSIGDNAFSGCTGLTSVIIGSGVTGIGSNAFANCSSLCDVYCYAEDLPGVNIMSPGATFSGTPVKNVTLHVPAGSIEAYKTTRPWSRIFFGSIVAIEEEGSDIIAFADANVKAICVDIWDADGDGELSKAEAAAVNSLGDVFEENETITSFDELQYFTGLTSIGNSTFLNCTGLTTISIPSSVTSIGSWAFGYCSSLTSVTIPESVTSIGNDAFSGTAWYDNQPDGLVYAGKVAYNYKGTMPENTNIVLQDGTLSIADYAFYDCYNLTSVTIPSSVTSIGDYAFWYCTGLTSVTIPSSVTSIDSYAFSGCYGLTSIIVEGSNSIYDSRNNCNAIIETATNTLVAGCQNTIIPESVTNIGANAFRGCSSLTSITIPSSVTNIEYCAFLNCTGLTSITIPSSVTSIGYGAFEWCSSLTSVTIGSGVTSIDSYVFAACSGLTSIIVEESNSIYDSRNNCNAIIETATNTLIAGCQNTIIPESVTSIGGGAFAGCFDLASITIPEGVKTLGDDAFYDCYNLTSVTIPSSVTSIGDYAFWYCTGLTDVYCLATNIPATELWTFDPTFFSVTLHVPAASIEAYKTTSPWCYFGKIVEIEETLNIDPMEKETEIAFDDAISEETDLSGTVVENMYITLDQKSGDGYSQDEGCLVISSTTTEEQVKALQENGMDVREIQESFNGIIMEVPAGKGTVTITAQTGSNRALTVKVGDSDAQLFVQLSQGTITVSYEVETPQYVYIYGTLKSSSSAKRRAEAISENAVKIYSVKWIPIDPTGIAAPSESMAEDATFYDLQGRRVSNPQQGVNIVRTKDGKSRKVLVK